MSHAPRHSLFLASGAKTRDARFTFTKDTVMASDTKALKRPRGGNSSEENAGVDRIDTVTEPKSKKARVEANRSLFVRSLPHDVTSEDLANFFSEHFPVKHATVVVDSSTKASRGFGFVTLTDPEDALEAKKKLNDEIWNGRRIVIDFAESRHRNEHGGAAKKDTSSSAVPPAKSKSRAIEDAWKSPKLIIRNLPWSVNTPEKLTALFQSYGKIKFADLPMKQGRLRGFGFITIRGQKNAENAISGVNGKVIDGRTLAVDWAVDKEEWDQQQDGDGAKPSKEANPPQEKTPEKTQKTPASAAAGSAPEDDDEQLRADLENFMQNHMVNLEEEKDDSDKEDEAGPDSSSDEDDEEDMEDESDGSESEGDDEDGGKSRANDNDKHKNSTVFIRNLPFTTTDEQLKDHFLKFGPVRYARVVKDRATDRPAGTGFVCFVDEEHSKACVKNSPRPQANPLIAKRSVLQDEDGDPTGKYTLEGRILQVAQAVTKDDAERLASTAGSKRRANDKRRLFLLEEGQLDTRSPLYQILSQAEIKMRDQSRTQRKKLVERNPSLHISLTRLAVRNVPFNLTSKDLKQLARQACVGFAKDVREGLREPLSKEEKARSLAETKEAEHQRKLKRKGIVSQAKIVFESKDGSKVSESAGGKSRGYGFIEYSSHRWALMGLRWLNGHELQNDQGKKQRLIVEFAIENAQVVARRRAQDGAKSNPKPKQGAEKGQEQEPSAAPETGKKGSKSKSAPRRPSQKSSKKFALKTGKKPDTPKEPAKTENTSSKSGAKDGSEDIKQKLIARKRLMRKKKAQSRNKGKA
ncbi:RNA recognition domain-containing protein [Sodiomyces alkalinus F11]|uniref:RNA recognition domain-containing protein n=1 Tax=Sodiomyces alkalinus (strain CBS 110278 / VKM F-3762 / F11) TaxID=1314773 RepID=A0A3N2PWD5_SODAK|nr:RNA recognition domain-containing protein [Sodiomyces alkalinus F11]ROT38810.1 RNA recognition domain-containing protein [Sodiomyces alkalinus F11]